MEQIELNMDMENDCITIHIGVTSMVEIHVYDKCTYRESHSNW